MGFHKTKAQQQAYEREINKLVLEPLQKNIVQNLRKATDVAEGWKVALDRAFTDPQYLDQIDEGAFDLADKTIIGLMAWHEKKTKTQFQKLFGIDVLPYLNNKATRAQLDPIIEFNIGLIKSIPKQLHDQVMEKYQDILYNDGFKQDTIINMLTDRFSVSYSRANLIASDQTNKTVGALTMIRHGQAGIKHFIWRTVEDQRVRTSHQLLDGKLYSWDNPPLDGKPATPTIPGQAVLCRCSAEPFIYGLAA